MRPHLLLFFFLHFHLPDRLHLHSLFRRVADKRAREITITSTICRIYAVGICRIYAAIGYINDLVENCSSGSDLYQYADDAKLVPHSPQIYRLRTHFSDWHCLFSLRRYSPSETWSRIFMFWDPIILRARETPNLWLTGYAWRQSAERLPRLRVEKKKKETPKTGKRNTSDQGCKRDLGVRDRDETETFDF